MTGIAEPYAQALDATGRILRGVPADRWHAATPGASWDAHALVNHLVSGNLRADAFGPEVAPPADASTQTAFSRCWARQAESALLCDAPLNATATNHSSRQVGG